MTNRRFIEINSLIRTGYENEYRPLIVYIDNIASYTEDREGYGEIRLVDGYVYIVKECALEIKRLIEQAESEEEE